MNRNDPLRGHPGFDHVAETTRIRARLNAPGLSALETAAMLAALELLRRHEQGSFELCENPYCVSLVTLCLGTPLELVHDTEDVDACSCCCHDLA